jgi:hypothetical protein
MVGMPRGLGGGAGRPVAEVEDESEDEGAAEGEELGDDAEDAPSLLQRLRSVVGWVGAGDVASEEVESCCAPRALGALTVP